MQAKLQAEDGHVAAEDGGCEVLDIADVLGRAYSGAKSWTL